MDTEGDGELVAGVSAEQQLRVVSKNLSLLRQKYAKLSQAYANLQRQVDLAQPHTAPTAGATGGVAGPPLHSGSLTADLAGMCGTLLLTDRFSDVRVTCADGRSLPAHRVVLAARSPVFDSLLAVPRDQEEEAVIALGESVPLDLATDLLKFVYTEALEVKHEPAYVQSLLVLAHKYKLRKLFSTAEFALVGMVTKDNCARLLKTADEVRADELRKAALEVIVNEFENLSDESLALLDSNLLAEIYRSKSPYPLHLAINQNREDVVFLYLIGDDASALIDSRNASGQTPLEVALSLRSMSIAQSLVEHNCNVEAVDPKTGQSSLYRALLRGDTHASLFYLKQGVNCEAQDRLSGRRPLHVASLLGLHSVAEALVGAGADINAPALRPVANAPAGDGAWANPFDARQSGGSDAELAMNDASTPLHIAASTGNLELATLFCAQPQLKVDALNSAGDSALWLALANRHPQVADLLCRSNAQVQSAGLDGYSWLHRAAREGNEFAADFLLSHGATPDLTSSAGETPLHLATRASHEGMVQLLLKFNADVNLRDDAGNAPLHEAIARESSEIVALLLAVADVDLNGCSGAGDSPLWLSLAGDQFDVAATLLERGADVDGPCGTAADGLQVPLYRAMREKREDLAVFLLEHGARIDDIDGAGGSALYHAIEHDMPRAVRAAVDRGANVNTPEGEQTPLDHALAVGAKRCVGVLVDRGADVNGKPAPGPDGRTLLEHRLEKSDTSAALYLILAGADVNGDTPGRTKERDAPLHYACRLGALDIIGELLQRGADVNRKNAAGDTPLHVAVTSRQADAVRALLSGEREADPTLRNAAGASVFMLVYELREADCGRILAAHSPRFSTEVVDAFGSTLLMFAVKREEYDGAAFLLQVLAVDPKQTGGSKTFDTPLHVVAHKGHTPTAQLIVARDPEACTLQNTRGRTPLHEAAAEGHVDMCALLLPLSASPVLRDIDGCTAVQVAVMASKADTAMMVASHGNGVFVIDQVNLMGQTALHTLAKYGVPLGKRCQSLLNLIIDNGVPLDHTDFQGNTALILAFLAVNETVALELVRRGASIVAANNDHVSCLDVITPEMEQAHPGRTVLQRRILELIREPPVWHDGPQCQICTSKFTVNKRKHHCRHCGRIACSACLPSTRKLPIDKFGEFKPVRLCAPCYDVLAAPSAHIAF